MKFNGGCGWRDFGKDWIHIDAGDYEHLQSTDIYMKDYKDDCADLIYASHVIEYFDREEIVELLECWKRVLKDGGILRVAVPDFTTMAVLYTEGDYSLNSFLGPLYGMMKMGDETIYHKTVYDFDILSEVLQSNGFKEPKLYDWSKTEHSEFDDHSQAYIPHMDKENGTLISLNVECVK